MHHANPLRSLLNGRARPAPVADPADMGTCFGLEMTLDEPPAAPQRPAEPGRSWWQRLSPRRLQGG